MTDEQLRAALRAALNAWEAAAATKKPSAEADEEREYLDAVTNGEEDGA